MNNDYTELSAVSRQHSVAEHGPSRREAKC
jgi:hypothetical protein